MSNFGEVTMIFPNAILTIHNWWGDQLNSYFSQWYLRVSECNRLDWDSSSALRYLILSHYLLLYPRIPVYSKHLLSFRYIHTLVPTSGEHAHTVKRILCLCVSTSSEHTQSQNALYCVCVRRK